MQSQIYFGLFKNRSDVEMVMQEALPPRQRATVEFAYRVGTWRWDHSPALADNAECPACNGTGQDQSMAFLSEQPCEECGGSGVPKAPAAPGQKFYENVLVFYSMDRRIYVFHGERNSSQSKWTSTILPRIRASEHIEAIPEGIARGFMTEKWGYFLKDAYVRMLALEEMFGDFEREPDRSALPKIAHPIPGVGTGRISAN